MRELNEFGRPTTKSRIRELQELLTVIVESEADGGVLDFHDSHDLVMDTLLFVKQHPVTRDFMEVFPELESELS